MPCAPRFTQDSKASRGRKPEALPGVADWESGLPEGRPGADVFTTVSRVDQRQLRSVGLEVALSSLRTSPSRFRIRGGLQRCGSGTPCLEPTLSKGGLWAPGGLGRRCLQAEGRAHHLPVCLSPNVEGWPPCSWNGRVRRRPDVRLSAGSRPGNPGLAPGSVTSGHVARARRFSGGT